MSIDAQGINALLAEKMPGCQINVDGGGGKFQVAIISDIFAGLNQVKRQQLVYQHLNAHIFSGDIHAVSMRLQTPDEAGV